MIRARIVLAVAAVAVLGACSQNGRQTSAERNESEAPDFGSATDIVRDSSRPTNDLNTADVGIGGPVQRATGNYQAQPIPGQNSDEELAKQVKVALTTGSMGTTGVIAEDQLTLIEVAVENGIVTLRGPAAGEREKRFIEQQVAGMKGVKGVRNELTAGARSVEDKPTEALVPRDPPPAR